MEKKFQAVLFDLDGTLLDTAKDFHAILNELLSEMQRHPIDYETVRKVASRGGAEMVRVALGAQSVEEASVKAFLPIFLKRYAENVANHTELFEGIDEVLFTLKERQIPWGIVTNKNTVFTTLLLKAFALPVPPHCVVCGDTLSRPKPHPDTLFHACALLSVKPKATLFVGDGMNDILAARNAKMPFVWAKYGYIHDTDNLPPLSTIEHPKELLAFL